MSALVIDLKTHRQNRTERAPQSPPLRPEHRAMALRIIDSAMPLTAWEENFARGMYYWKDEPTRKQMAWLRRLVAELDDFERRENGR